MGTESNTVSPVARTAFAKPSGLLGSLLVAASLASAASLGGCDLEERGDIDEVREDGCALTETGLHQAVVVHPTPSVAHEPGHPGHFSYEEDGWAIPQLKFTQTPTDADLGKWAMVEEGLAGQSAYRLLIMKSGAESMRRTLYSHTWNGTSYGYGQDFEVDLSRLLVDDNDDDATVNNGYHDSERIEVYTDGDFGAMHIGLEAGMTSGHRLFFLAKNRLTGEVGTVQFLWRPDAQAYQYFGDVSFRPIPGVTSPGQVSGWGTFKTHNANQLYAMVGGELKHYYGGRDSIPAADADHWPDFVDTRPVWVHTDTSRLDSFQTSTSGDFATVGSEDASGTDRVHIYFMGDVASEG